MYLDVRTENVGILFWRELGITRLRDSPGNRIQRVALPWCHPLRRTNHTKSPYDIYDSSHHSPKYGLPHPKKTSVRLAKWNQTGKSPNEIKVFSWENHRTIAGGWIRSSALVTINHSHTILIPWLIDIHIRSYEIRLDHIRSYQLPISNWINHRRS